MLTCRHQGNLEAIRLIVEEGRSVARLYIPHYWAVYYHDGRPGASPNQATFLVFFADAKDDPRIPNGVTPERYSEVGRFTRGEYNDGLAENAIRRENGENPFMYVFRRVGPSPSHRFFDRLAEGAANRADPLAERIFDRHIQEFLDDCPDLRPEKKTATFYI